MTGASRPRRQNLICDLDGTRLDRFLADRLGRYSRSHFQDLIARGQVTVDGAGRSADYRLKEGQRVEVSWPAPDWAGADDFEKWIIHEDKHLLVLDKPSGLLMHPLGTSWLSAPEAALAEPAPNLAAILQGRRPALLKAGLERCGIVHRLDQQTSGVLLVAKTRPAQKALIEAFKERRVRKFYRAVIRGVPEDKAPRVSAPVGRRPGHRRIIVTPFGKDAETAFKVLETGRGAALVEARPLTGRTHQIRAHLAFLGHPVMGDLEFDKPAEGALKPPRMLLHAHRIEFEHPGTGREASFAAPLPRDFREFWKLCRKV